MTRLSLAGSVQQPSRPPRGLIGLVLLLVIVGGAYWQFNQADHSPHVSDGAPAVATAPPAPTDAAIEDVENHLQHAREDLTRIQEAARRIDQRLNQVAPTLDQNFLRLERQRLDSADQLSNSVLREAGDALDELELTNQTLKNRRR